MIEPISQTLWEINNKEGSIENYKYFAMVGLHDFISQDERDYYEELSKEINKNGILCP